MPGEKYLDMNRCASWADSKEKCNTCQACKVSRCEPPPRTITISNPKCKVPDDRIDSRRYSLFMARDVMRGLIKPLKAEEKTES
jgi:hypothetical protein